MSTSNFQFFARRAEIISMIADLAGNHGLWLIAPGEDRCQLVKPGELANADFRNLNRVFLAASQPSPDELVAREVIPARLGWLQFDLPKECGRQLYLADFAVKSDWYDRASRAVRTNTEMMQIYRKLRRDLRASLMSPVWAKNVKTGGVAKYRDMAFSRGAEQWEKEGGELRQRGVANVRFSASQLESDACC